MRKRDIKDALERLKGSSHFVAETYELVDQWEAAGVGIEALEPILRFMEKHPDIDFGTPGPLVAFVESVPNDKYNEILAASLSRKPVPHTVWMLNRVINATKAPAERTPLIALMSEVEAHPEADENTRDQARENLVRLREIEEGRAHPGRRRRR
jgi:hypothetical protein